MGQLRMYDKLFRYGGEEFLICLPGMSAADSTAVIERLRAALAQRNFALADGTTLQVTASFGVTGAGCHPAGGGDPGSGRQGTVSAKAAGRNCVRPWDPAQ